MGIEVLDLRDLRVSPAYQRSLNASRARKMAKEWDWRAYQPIRVARRVDGSLWIIDGQHTAQALILMGATDAECSVRDSRGSGDEAAEFAKRNGKRVALTSMQVLQSEREAGNPDVCALYNFAATVGLCIVAKGGDNPRHIRFGHTLWTWWRKDRDAAKRALAFTREVILPTDCMIGEVFAGAALLFHRGVPINERVDKVREVGGVAAWKQRINAMRATRGIHHREVCEGFAGALPMVCAQCILDAANVGIRRNSKAFLTLPAKGARA